MGDENERGWGADSVRQLRRTLQLTQRELADSLGVRQQTISEWETGAYEPRGASARLLDIVAERAGFTYGEPGGNDEASAEPSPEGSPERPAR